MSNKKTTTPITMTKFWKVTNKAEEETAELLIYGEIVSEQWFDDETAPKQFADALAALDGKPLTLRINSPGGDVFAAQAIYNKIRDYPGAVTVKIDGLSASAATIITCAGDTVIMPENALYMIHNPLTIAVGNADEMRKTADTLDTVRDTIVNVYLKRTGGKVGADDIKSMMDAESWLTAQEALGYGFVDVIDKETPVEDNISGNMLIMNSVSCDLAKFKHGEKVKEILNRRQTPTNHTTTKPKGGRKTMENQETATILQKIADKLGITEKAVESVATQSIEDAVKAERSRICNLEAMLTGDKVVDGIINAAKANGQTADEIKPYIDVVTEARKDEPKDGAVEAIKNIIEDNLQSGAEGVAAGAPAVDEKQAAIDEIVNIANGK